MACGVILPDGSIKITHPDINIWEVAEAIKEQQKLDGEELTPCHKQLVSIFTGRSTEKKDDVPFFNKF